MLAFFLFLSSFPFVHLPLNLVPSVSSKAVVIVQTQIWLLNLNEWFAPKLSDGLSQPAGIYPILELSSTDAAGLEQQMDTHTNHVDLYLQNPQSVPR